MYKEYVQERRFLRCAKSVHRVEINIKREVYIWDLEK